MSQGLAAVLEALRRAAPAACSGEALSADVGVSRAQIWKHVEALRRRDYQIEGVPGDGYRLLSIPDRLYREEITHGIETRWLAREIHYLDTTDSTNRVALELAQRGAPHGTAVVAEGQTAGRGRLGRSFFSPPHLNLYTSIILRPELTTVEAPTLILTTAVAVADAVCETASAAAGESRDADVEIKWPNDVLLGGRKTSGILMEMSAEATRVKFAVLGIGVNLNVDRESFPEEFRHLATSLRSHVGAEIDRVAFCRRLYGRLEEVLDAHARDGFAALRPRFEARFRMPGRRVRVAQLNGPELTGVARAIASDGALEIRQSDGEIVRVIAGDVTLARKETLP